MTAILNMLLSEKEITIIKANAHWQDDKNEYIISPFYIKDKLLKFPKLPLN